jgi:hypothetical protein
MKAIFLICVAALCLLPRATDAAGVKAEPNAAATIWRDPGDIASLNLYYGAGGKKHEPAGDFTFISEDKGGSTPKFDIVDENGASWRGKLGEEAQPETAATRLLWAAGYYVDEDYYISELRVAGMPKLSRGAEFISADGVIHGVRLKRKDKGIKSIGNWSWFENPFTGTRELSGLKIMMALVNNWDLKEVNNDIYQVHGGGQRYLVSDLGAGLGRTGNGLTRSKNNLKDYAATLFIQNVTPDDVDFVLNSRPFFLGKMQRSNYAMRANMEEIVKHIPRADANWLGRLLGRLSARQIEDCFRAAGYRADEVERFTRVVLERIRELREL